VYLFSVLRRQAVFAMAKSCLSLSSEVFHELPCHPDGRSVAPVSEREIGDLLWLHVANRIEQASKPVTGIGYWLSSVGDQVKHLMRTERPVPGVLARLQQASFDDERRLQSLYLQGLSSLRANDPPSGVRSLQAACDEYGFVGEPYVMLGIARCLLGDTAAAQQAAEKGRDLLLGLGTSWHKCLSQQGWLEICDFVRRGISHSEVGSVLPKIVQTHSVFPGQSNAYGPLSPVAADSQGSQPEVARFFSYLEAIRTHRTKESLKFYPGLSRVPWHDPAQFALTAALESHFAQIKAEALQVRTNFYHEEAEQIGRTGSWQVCMFYEQGRRNDFVCEQCPVISSIIDKHLEVRRSAGLIYLSCLGPQTHVAPHQGGSNLRLRCHFALSVPSGDCAMRVGEEVRHWEEGRCLVFDDTFEHEVWNRTDQPRLVLLIDLWHPDLARLEREALEALNWIGISRANEIVGAWARNDAQRKREGKFGYLQRSGFVD